MSKPEVLENQPSKWVNASILTEEGCQDPSVSTITLRWHKRRLIQRQTYLGWRCDIVVRNFLISSSRFVVVGTEKSDHCHRKTSICLVDKRFHLRCYRNGRKISQQSKIWLVCEFTHDTNRIECQRTKGRFVAIVVNTVELRRHPVSENRLFQKMRETWTLQLDTSWNRWIQ